MNIKIIYNEEQLKRQISAYKTTFFIENILRVSMHNIMLKIEGHQYFNETIFPPFVLCNSEINVVKESIKRKHKEKKYNLDLGYEFPDLWYLDFRILVELLDIYWVKYFHLMLRRVSGSGKEFIPKIKNLPSTRNAIAHNRYISQIDLKDLDVAYRILKNNVEVLYLENFDSFVFNSLESNMLMFKRMSDGIISKIEKGTYINEKEILEYFKMIDVISIQDNLAHLRKSRDLILSLLEGYDRLPRKPGKYSDIKKYAEKHGLITKIKHLTSGSGGSHGL